MRPMVSFAGVKGATFAAKFWTLPSTLSLARSLPLGVHV